MAINNIKFLHEFNVPREQEVDDVQVSKNEKGEEVSVTTKVKKDVPVTLGIRKPTRSLQDDGDLYFSVQVSKAVQAGVMTRAMLAKHLKNAKGVLSDSEMENYNKLTDGLLASERALYVIQAKKTEDLTEKDNADKQVLIEQINSATGELIEFQNKQAQLFNYTAENTAKTKTIGWWLVNLAFIKNDKTEWVPFFGEGNLEDKLNKYDELAETGDPFSGAAIQKLLVLVVNWYNGNLTTKEDFEKFEKSLS